MYVKIIDIDIYISGQESLKLTLSCGVMWGYNRACSRFL